MEIELLKAIPDLPTQLASHLEQQKGLVIIPLDFLSFAPTLQSQLGHLWNEL